MTSANWPSGNAKTDLDDAVTAGVIDRETCQKIVAFLQSRNAESDADASADEEQLRLVTGFNDIFVTIGLGLFLGALSYLLQGMSPVVSAASAAVASWLLAEFFSRRKRMALPSIALLLVFVSSVLLAAYATLNGGQLRGGISDALNTGSVALAFSCLAAALAAAAHWMRFHVPITVAAGFVAVAILIVAAVSSLIPGIIQDHPAVVFIPLGLAAFALAMRFDMSDRQRLTRRTDIAFWLHLIAAPTIVHPLIISLGIAEQQGLAGAISVFLIFAILCLVALVIDRRAVLVSSLGYLAYAAYTLVTVAGWGSASAFGVLLVGAIVLLLSAAWRPLRAIVLGFMPDAVACRIPPAAQAPERTPR